VNMCWLDERAYFTDGSPMDLFLFFMRARKCVATCACWVSARTCATSLMGSHSCTCDVHEHRVVAAALYHSYRAATAPCLYAFGGTRANVFPSKNSNIMTHTSGGSLGAKSCAFAQIGVMGGENQSIDRCQCCPFCQKSRHAGWFLLFACDSSTCCISRQGRAMLHKTTLPTMHHQMQPARVVSAATSCQGVCKSDCWTQQWNCIDDAVGC